jgi:hypothetical protein
MRSACLALILVSGPVFLNGRLESEVMTRRLLFAVSGIFLKTGCSRGYADDVGWPFGTAEFFRGSHHHLLFRRDVTALSIPASAYHYFGLWLLTARQNSVKRFIGNALDVSLGVWYFATKGIILLKSIIVTNTRYTSCC